MCTKFHSDRAVSLGAVSADRQPDEESKTYTTPLKAGCKNNMNRKLPTGGGGGTFQTRIKIIFKI
jgi:hypothetical protein